MYPGLAVAVGLEGVVTLGVAWYLLRWRLIPLPVRLVGVAILVLFCADLLVAAFGYAIGQP
jgi:peptidoglycan biosynthesis protein MviN/MurJ (putative lipid II flippase)